MKRSPPTPIKTEKQLYNSQQTHTFILETWKTCSHNTCITPKQPLPILSDTGKQTKVRNTFFQIKSYKNSTPSFHCLSPRPSHAPSLVVSCFLLNKTKSLLHHSKPPQDLVSCFILSWTSFSDHERRFTDLGFRARLKKRILQQKPRSSFCLQKPFIQIKICCFLFFLSISSTFWRKFGRRCAKKTNSTDQRRWCDDNF